MDELLGPLREALDGPIDFHGQRVTDFLSTALLILFAVSYTQEPIIRYTMVELGICVRRHLPDALDDAGRLCINDVGRCSTMAYI
ncbi:hypothetical protein MGYG_03846 [Nannizzia gypsea CBS 118893]|uniref:Uncharacterized protein n=1 Tax=Arthroderma gypseum (strain ATCC MYA-4604 / CBS 118893) TaxID=535722 RepID=E4UU74_ARTGP|nr:hypothetical protein MGYG_03846 [Nannizzia gypsea CBS 118893]EFR00841.1 hypothetical protein MGYG_03846 [Nannizzia gypsea CBS 118893]